MTRPFLLATTLAAAAALGGCDSASLDKAAETGSLFALIETDTPATAARDMVDPYNADKRFSGTLKIANAPFGGEDVYLKIYREHLTDEKEDIGVRAVSAWALGMHGESADVPLILPLLNDKDKRVRLTAARSLQRVHNPVAIDPLVAATRPSRVASRRGADGNAELYTIQGEDDKDVRAAAATAMAQYPDTRVLQALIAATDDDELLVSASAADSLKILTGQDFRDDRRAWTKWADQTKEPFAGRSDFYYPIFDRDKYWWEYVPFVPNPPNEKPGTPAGMPVLAK